MTKKSAKQKIVKANLTRIFEVIFSETSKNFCSFHLKIPILFKLSEAIVQRCSVKNSQNSQEDSCAKVSFLIKLQV